MRSFAGTPLWDGICLNSIPCISRLCWVRTVSSLSPSLTCLATIRPGGAAKVDVGSQFFFGTMWRFAVLAGSASLSHWPGAGICYFAPDICSSLPSWLDRQRATAFLKERGHHRAAGPRKTVLRVRRRTATESTRVAAMAAFAKSWRRESLAPAHEAVRGRASRVLGPVSTAPGLPAIALRF